MKTKAKNTKLNLEKFQIAKLHNLTKIMGGANENNNSSTDTWTTTHED